MTEQGIEAALTAVERVGFYELLDFLMFRREFLGGIKEWEKNAPDTESRTVLMIIPKHFPVERLCESLSEALGRDLRVGLADIPDARPTMLLLPPESRDEL